MHNLTSNMICSCTTATRKMGVAAARTRPVALPRSCDSGGSFAAEARLQAVQRCAVSGAQRGLHTQRMLAEMLQQLAAELHSTADILWKAGEDSCR